MYKAIIIDDEVKADNYKHYQKKIARNRNGSYGIKDSIWSIDF